MKNKIYVASHTRHAADWRRLRDAGAPIRASWIDAGPVEPDGKREFWRRCIAEASACDHLIVYVPGDPLNGAIAEVGAALASGAYVLWVGDTISVAEHPLATRCVSLATAIAMAMERSDLAFASWNHDCGPQERSHEVALAAFDDAIEVVRYAKDLSRDEPCYV